MNIYKAEVKFLLSHKVVFWDFDGVIKDSVGIKKEAYANLYTDINEEIRNKIKEHHCHNLGISRLEKIPIYMNWAGLKLDPFEIDFFLKKLSVLVDQLTISSAWIPKVLDFIQ